MPKMLRTSVWPDPSVNPDPLRQASLQALVQAPSTMEAATVANWIAALTAAFTLGTVLVAVYVVKAQLRQGQELHEVDLILKLEDRFDSGPLRQARYRAAKFLSKAGPFDTQRAEAWASTSDVIDFFQTVGLFQRYGRVRPELTHSWFAYWWEHYYYCCKNYIAFERSRTPGSWDDAVDLHERFLTIDKQKNWATTITPEDAAWFLHQEIASNAPTQSNA